MILNSNTEKYTVMIVDDTPDNIDLFSELLKEKYHVRVALNGERALQLIREEQPDIILLDVMMPILDGYETCRRLKADKNLKHIPVIFLTAKSDAEDENIGLSLGAVDYITKPVNPQIFLSRIHAHLSTKLANDFLKHKNRYLEDEVILRTKEVTALQEVTIMAMSSLAEIRDNETGHHLQRTKLYAGELCQSLARMPKYKEILDKSTIQKIVNAVPLHDIGKVGIPDSILLKPAKLTTEEFEIMKTHTVLGKEAIEKAEKMLDYPDGFLSIPKEIVYCHHEKWDGSGYPQGLSKESIPLSARIVALVDVYDALRSKRIYKPSYTHDEVLDIIGAERGKHFAEDIVDAFLEVHNKFYDISTKFSEE
jgi:Response regulator containing a CheY-like receiver domain and an HD-GYP domain